MKRGSRGLPLLAGLAALLLSPRPAGGHPLDEYVQASYITLAKERVAVEINLTPGVHVAREILAIVDGDGDGRITEAEGRAYAARVLREISLAVGDETLPLRLTRGDFPSTAAVLRGQGTIRLRFASASWSGTGGARRGTHRLRFRNGHEPARSAYLVNAYLPPAPFTITAQRRDYYQRGVDIDYAVAGSPWLGWLSLGAAMLAGTAVAGFALKGRHRRSLRWFPGRA